MVSFDQFDNSNRPIAGKFISPVKFHDVTDFYISGMAEGCPFGTMRVAYDPIDDNHTFIANAYFELIDGCYSPELRSGAANPSPSHRLKDGLLEWDASYYVSNADNIPIYSRVFWYAATNQYEVLASETVCK